MKTKLKVNKRIVYFWIVLIGLIISLNILDRSRVDREAFNEVAEQSKKYVYPVGNIVGIKANTDGALVIGYEDDSVEYIGGIKKGDNIVKVNDEKIENAKDIIELINKVKRDEVDITFERDGKYKTEKIKTKCENGVYRLGIWVRDRISGIGTVTFYDPSTDTFSGIGHAITDSDTNTLLSIKEGEIYNPTSVEIIKGTKEKVGEINGEFKDEEPIGKFSNNTPFGICGKIINDKEKYNDIQLIEVGNSKDVKIGKASIIFQNENKELDIYDISIDNILEGDKDERDMVISIVDEDLISYTGGVIKGMSGVPIIQNNKIIGAITHVFKDNPKKGYGIFIDEMLKLDK